MLLNLIGHTKVISLYMKQNPSADRQQPSITNWQRCYKQNDGWM